MPERKTIERARRAKREGKPVSTQAGEFVREEVAQRREGRGGATSTAQAVAIGLSKARRAGVSVPPPRNGEASDETRRKAQRDLKAGEKPRAVSQAGTETARRGKAAPAPFRKAKAKTR